MFLKRDKLNSQSGLTYMELLVVLAIIGLFALVATPSVIKAVSTAKLKATQMELDNLDTTLGLYFAANLNKYPPDLKTLVSEGFFKDDSALVDAFGRHFQYKPISDSEYLLYSLGKDGVPSKDDLQSRNSVIP